MTDRSVNYYPSSNGMSSKIGNAAEKYSMEKISISFKNAKGLPEPAFSGDDVFHLFDIRRLPSGPRGVSKGEKL
jgi:hypothetical protein